MRFLVGRVEERDMSGEMGRGGLVDGWKEGGQSGTWKCGD